MWWLWACGPSGNGETDPPDPVEEYADDGLDIIRSSFENPTWELGGIVLFSGPVGTLATRYTETTETLECVFADHTYDDETYWLAPEAPHVPAYDAEIFDGLVDCARTSRATYERADFVGGVGIFLGFAMIPVEGAPTGRTTDSPEALPLISTAFLPVDVATTLVQNGVDFHPGLDQHGPRLADLDMADKDGLSHWPVAQPYAFNETPDFVDLDGDWSFEVVITDEKGAGWNLTVPFTISDPGSGS